MAYRSWSTPTGLLSGGRSGYSLGGPGNRSASLAALRAISNPREVANIASQPLPVDEFALQEQQDTPIVEAMRGPATRRSAAPVVGSTPGTSTVEQAVLEPEIDIGFEHSGHGGMTPEFIYESGDSPSGYKGYYSGLNTGVPMRSAALQKWGTLLPGWKWA